MSISLPRACSSAVGLLSYRPHPLTTSSAVVSFAAWKETMWRAGAVRIVARLDFRTPVASARCFASRPVRRKASAVGEPARSAEEVTPGFASSGASKKAGSEEASTAAGAEGIAGAAAFRVKRKGRGKGALKVMEENPFYVVRKGRTIGVYRSLADCQAQVSASVGDPSVGVYKGYSLSKQTEEYLASLGLRDALYCIDAENFKEDLFGTIVPCPFEEPDGHFSSGDKAPAPVVSLKRTKDACEMSCGTVLCGSVAASSDVPVKQPRRANSSCIIEFDGASKGNPGKAGAGVVLKREDGTIISKLRQGLGMVTNNVAEYRALLLGLNYARQNGFEKILAQGDSQLVCSQVEGSYKTKNAAMAELCKQVRELKKSFLSFQICHVKREFNSAADALANLAVHLPCDEICEESADAV